MRPLFCALLLFCALSGPARAELAPGRARVNAPVADLRKEPKPPEPGLDHDPLEESQLLEGDPVEVLEVRGDWARVSAVDQQEWTHNRKWEGYPGWMRVVDLVQDPGGWAPKKAVVADKRKEIVKSARAMLGVPYYWGGRSPRAVDCSGLTGLCYQTAGVQIPRDAHEQWMKARPISRENLQPGDLVFLADPENALKITHVMLYAGEGRVIEAPGTGSAVREIPLEERLRLSPDRRAHFGSCLE